MARDKWKNKDPKTWQEFLLMLGELQRLPAYKYYRDPNLVYCKESGYVEMLMGHWWLTQKGMDMLRELRLGKDLE